MNTESAFLKRFESIEFCHHLELLQSLSDGRASADIPIIVPVAEVLEFFLRWQRHLGNTRGTYAKARRDDVARCCAFLYRRSGQEVEMWGFALDPNIVFAVLVSTGEPVEIVCVRAYDKERTGPR